MNIVWLFSYFADCAFTVLYFRRKTYAPRPRRSWLKPALLLAFLPLYLNNTVLTIPFSFVRVAVRILLYLSWLYWAEGVPFHASFYTALFWTAVYTLFQNVFFGPVLNQFFMGQISIVASPLWSQVLLSAVNVLVRVIFFGTIAMIFPFSGMAGTNLFHLVFMTSVCLVAVYTKSTSTGLLAEFNNSPAQFSTYFILLHVSILLFLLAFEYSRRQSVEYAAMALRHAASQHLVENIQERRQNEESLRALRHDLKNHAITLQLLLERQEIPQAIEYLQHFEAQIVPPTNHFQTGNDLLDGLLCQKLLPVIDKGIKVGVSIDFRLGTFINDFDLCTLMGNLLDNAIDAALQVIPPDPSLICVTGGPAANCLLLRIENSCLARTHSGGNLPPTTKADKMFHGFGLRNVRQIVGKYGGTLTISTNEENRFTVNILLPIPR